MTIPFFLPIPYYVKSLKLRSPMTLKALCDRAGVCCAATGAWTDRLVEITPSPLYRIIAEPGDWGSVRIELPKGIPLEQARRALAIMAYAMHDLVAKQSLHGVTWMEIRPPVGRPKSPNTMSNAERQRRFRAKKAL